MSDRDLREVNQAMQRELLSIKRELEVMRSRVWRGALRMAHSSSVTAVTPTPDPVLSIDIESGRWAAFIQGHPIIGAHAITDSYGIDAAVTALGTDDLLFQDNLPYAIIHTNWVQQVDPDPEGPGFVPTVVPLASFGDLVVTERVTVSLRIFHEAAILPAWADLRLMLMPV